MIRILFFADTHLGIDYPARRKAGKTYRGDDFFVNYELLLAKASTDNFDLVIHGGDLFDRSSVPSHVVNRAYDGLFALADRGVPVILVPGNHDRSTLPTSLFLQHPNLHIVYEPSVNRIRFGNQELQVAGFPFIRKIGLEISDLISGFSKEIDHSSPALLLMHQSVEGAVVGPQSYTFRRGADVIAQDQLDGPYLAFLSGHIHPHQVLRIPGVNGRKIPFIYPGSIETTSFAERGEIKGYTILTLDEGHQFDYTFHPLPHRSLEVVVPSEHLRGGELQEYVEAQLNLLPERAFVRIKCDHPEQSKYFNAARIRALSRRGQLLKLSYTSGL